jgi:uroporphyrinogen III methyltransferase/synthase
VAAADRAPLEIEQVLEPMGVEVRRVAVYETVPAGRREPKIDLAERGIEVVFLASPSAVQGLAAQAAVPPSAKLISIGPSTSEAIRQAGWQVAGEARTRDIEGLVEAIP